VDKNVWCQNRPGQFLICLETLRYWLSQPVWTSSSTPLTQLV